MAEALRPGGLYQDGDVWRDAAGVVVDAPSGKEKRAATDKSKAVWEREQVLVESTGRPFRAPAALREVEAAPDEPLPTAASDQPSGPLPPATDEPEARGDSGLVGRASKSKGNG